MSLIIIRLQNLPWSASAHDVREFFAGLSIPEGGVHIVGGQDGDAFIQFANDEDARLAMRLDGKRLHDTRVRLLLSSQKEMQKVIEKARSDYAASLAVAQQQQQQPQPVGGVAPCGMGGPPSGIYGNSGGGHSQQQQQLTMDSGSHLERQRLSPSNHDDMDDERYRRSGRRPRSRSRSRERIQGSRPPYIMQDYGNSSYESPFSASGTNSGGGRYSAYLAPGESSPAKQPSKLDFASVRNIDFPTTATSSGGNSQKLEFPTVGGSASGAGAVGHQQSELEKHTVAAFGLDKDFKIQQQHPSSTSMPQQLQQMAQGWPVANQLFATGNSAPASMFLPFSLPSSQFGFQTPSHQMASSSQSSMGGVAQQQSGLPHGQLATPFLSHQQQLGSGTLLQGQSSSSMTTPPLAQQQLQPATATSTPVLMSLHNQQKPLMLSSGGGVSSVPLQQETITARRRGGLLATPQPLMSVQATPPSAVQPGSKFQTSIDPGHHQQASMAPTGAGGNVPLLSHQISYPLQSSASATNQQVAPQSLLGLAPHQPLASVAGGLKPTPVPLLDKSMFREGIFMDNFRTTSSVGGQKSQQAVYEPGAAVCVENLPRDLLRYGMIRDFFAPLRLEGHDSIKLQNDMQKSYCRFATRYDAQLALRLDGKRQGVRIRPCSDHEFDMAMETITNAIDPRPLRRDDSYDPSQQRGSASSRFSNNNDDDGGGGVSCRFLVEISNIGYKTMDRQILDFLMDAGPRPRQLWRKMVIKNGRRVVSDTAFAEYYGERDTDVACRLSSRRLDDRPLTVKRVESNLIQKLDCRPYEFGLGGASGGTNGPSYRNRPSSPDYGSPFFHGSQHQPNSLERRRDEIVRSPIRRSSRRFSRSPIRARRRSRSRSRSRSGSGSRSKSKQGGSRDKDSRSSRRSHRLPVVENHQASSSSETTLIEKDGPTRRSGESDHQKSMPASSQIDLQRNGTTSTTTSTSMTTTSTSIQDPLVVKSNETGGASTQHQTCLIVTGLAQNIQTKDVLAFLSPHQPLNTQFTSQGTTAYMEFTTTKECEQAFRAKNKHYMGVQMVTLKMCSKAEMLDAVPKLPNLSFSNSSKSPKSENGVNGNLSTALVVPSTPVIDPQMSAMAASLGPPGSVCFVHNLPPRITLEEICGIFEKFKLIESSVRMHYSHLTGEPTGDCLLAFQSATDAQAACKHLTNLQTIPGHNGTPVQICVVTKP